MNMQLTEIINVTRETVWGIGDAHYFFMIGASAGALFLACLYHVFRIERYRESASAGLAVALSLGLAAPLNLIVNLYQPGRFYYQRPIQIYNETLGTSINSMNGRRFVGTPTWIAPLFADGTPIRSIYKQEDWPFTAVSTKSQLMSAMSIGALKLQEIHPSNAVVIHRKDALSLGIENGDRIRLTYFGVHYKLNKTIKIINWISIHAQRIFLSQ